MSGFTRDHASVRALLNGLLERVREGMDISGLLCSRLDSASIRAGLHPLCGSPFSIDSIAIGESRIDAVVTAGAETARLVFDLDHHGGFDWLHAYVKPAPFAGVPGGRLAVVNGPSGAGKSTLMQALQAIATFPLVVLDEPEHIGTVQAGYLIWRDSAPSLHAGYLAAIAALARAGNHVALPAAGHSHEEIVAAFAGIELIRIGLRCDLAVLDERERRTGRWAGIAAESLGVHDGWTYDIEFDTTDAPDPIDLANRVLAMLTT